MAFSRRACVHPCPHVYCNGHVSTNFHDEKFHACLYCSRTFSQVSFLVRHVSSQHPENMYGGSGRNTSMTIGPRFSRKHPCPHCDEVCSKKYILGNHVRAMHAALQATESTESVPSSPDEGESSASESPRRDTPFTPRMRNCFPQATEKTRSNAPSPTDSLMDFYTQAKADTIATERRSVKRDDRLADMGYPALSRSFVLASLLADMKKESEGR